VENTSIITPTTILHHVPNLGAYLRHIKIPVSNFFFNAFFEVVQGA